jgi:serine/threonine protein kinase
MLTGQLPFKGDYELAVIYSIMNEEPEPVSSLRAGVPVELERIIHKALSKAPSERYQHAEDLLVDLRRLNKESKPGMSVPGKTSERDTPRNRTVGLVIGTVAMILVLFLGIMFLSKKQSQPPPSTTTPVI